MPRNGSGVYSADWVNAAPNTTIESAKQNAMVADLVTDANAARPITAGGTGETTARLKDGTWRLQNTSDTTKLVAFDLSGLSTATTRTVTMGDANVTLRPQIWEHIQTKTASGATNIEFPSLGLYQYLRARAYLTVSVDLATILLQTSTDGGSTYASVGNDYNNQTLNAFSTTVSTSNANAAGFRLANGVGNTSPECASINFEMFEFNKSLQAMLTCHANYLDGTTTPIIGIYTGRRLSTTGRNALRILPDSGTISGTVILEGIRG